MENHTAHLDALGAAADARWQTPTAEVISLSCEITAYAADDAPLF